jgi:hypothetical protein
MTALYRPRAAVSGAFALGTFLAFVAHMFILNTRPSDLRLPPPTQNDLLVLAGALTVYGALFFAGLLVLKARHAQFRARSVAVATAYGMAVYAVAFLAVLLLFHLAVEPSLSLYAFMMAGISFIAGAVFAKFFGHAAQ